MGGRKTAKSSGLHMRDCVRKDEENMKWKQERQPFISKHRKDCETAERLGWFWLVEIIDVLKVGSGK